jgi:DNA-binding beta-propeller fold protein YncE
MLKKSYHLYVLVLMLVLPVLQAAAQNQSARSQRVLYVSNFNSNTITAYDATTGAFLDTVVQAGPELSGANGFAIAQDGSFYVAGQFSNNVVHYSKQGKLVEILDPNNLGGVSSPQGVNIGPDGLLYVASFDNDKIVRYDLTNAQFKDNFVPVQLDGIPHMGPIEPRFESDHNLVVSTFDGGRILKYQGPAINAGPAGAAAPVGQPAPGTLLRVFDLPPAPVGAATDTATLSYASGDTLDACLSDGSCSASSASGTLSGTLTAGLPAPPKRFYVDAIDPTTLTGEVQEFLEDGSFVARIVPNGTAGLVLTGGIGIGPDGNLYIANIRVDANFQDIGSEVLRFDPVSGQFLGRLVPAGAGLNVPFAMRFGRR